MTDQVLPSEPPVSGEPVPAETTPTPEATPVVDPAAAVEAQVAEQLKQIRSLDDLDPDARALVESHTSRAVNDALRNQQDKGDYISRLEMERVLAAERQATINEMAARDAARDSLYENLHEHGITPGTPAYSEFAEASQFFKPEHLLSKEGVSAIVRSMPSQAQGSMSSTMPGSGMNSSFDEMIATSSGDAEGLKAGGVGVHAQAAELLRKANRRR